jgi:hypothetical protein
MRDADGAIAAGGRRGRRHFASGHLSFVWDSANNGSWDETGDYAGGATRSGRWEISLRACTENILSSKTMPSRGQTREDRPSGCAEIL